MSITIKIRTAPTPPTTHRPRGQMPGRPAAPVEFQRFDVDGWNYAVNVFGTPAPQGSKTIGFNHSVREDNPRTKPWRNLVTKAIKETYNLQPLEGSLVVDLLFVFERPKSIPKDRGPHTKATNDVDKLCRCVLDAGTNGGLWKDDGQVTQLRAMKAYTDPDVAQEPGLFLMVKQVP